MTPLHPIAAAAAGVMLGLAALTAPNTPQVRGLTVISGCNPTCSDLSQPTPTVGMDMPEDEIHHITMPGRYGLSQPANGYGYAVVGGHLVRIDAVDGHILSVLRPAPRILD